MQEVWKDVVGWENRYEVSNIGNVRSKVFTKHVNRLGSEFSYQTKSKVLKLTICKKGYAAIALRSGDNSLYTRVHVLVAKAFLWDTYAEGLQVNHKNGNKLDNSVDNLGWVTPSENVLHSYSTGLKSNKGDNHSQKIVNSKIVRQIREEHSCGSKVCELARSYELNYATVWAIVKHKTWEGV